jgi:glycosyltransferase involved in cell wall biosynthesis
VVPPDQGLPLVSILTPTYNHERFIAACIESVLHQTYTNWEMLIVDDGSSDRTGELARGYTDPRIKYRRQEHVGLERLADTYNSALHASSGTLVAILEGDDTWAPDMLSVLVPKLLSSPAVLAYGQTEIMVGDRLTGRRLPDESTGRRFGRTALNNNPVGSATRAMLHGDVRVFSHAASTLIRRDALEALGGFPHVEGFFAVDYPMLLGLSLTAPFDYSDRVVAHWRRHAAAGSWLNQEAMMERGRRFALSFAQEHAIQLSLTAAEMQELDRSWAWWLNRAAIHRGRLLLLQRQWAESRIVFARTLRSRDPVVVGAALLGYLASWLHTDIERFVGWTGHLGMRETGQPSA